MKTWLLFWKTRMKGGIFVLPLAVFRGGEFGDDVGDYVIRQRPLSVSRRQLQLLACTPMPKAGHVSPKTRSLSAAIFTRWYFFVLPHNLDGYKWWRLR